MPAIRAGLCPAEKVFRLNHDVDDVARIEIETKLNLVARFD